jgi:hypothetical protein
MKHRKRPILPFLFAISLPYAIPAAAQPKPTKTFTSKGNPILGDGSYFSADAAPLSFDGKLYIYAGHDEPAEDVGGFVMNDWGVFVTTDPKSGQWELYQANLDAGTVFTWATGRNAYAGQVTRGADGKFYWYVPVQSKRTDVTNPMAIGVAVSDGPLGPWKDAIGKPLVDWTSVFGDSKRGEEIIDPHLFTDDDGTHYLYWGSWYTARVVKLDKSMTAMDGQITKLDGLDYLFEAPWVFKRNGIYYCVYDWKHAGSQWTPSNYQAAIGYATASSPLGPWKFQNIILSGTSATTVHPSLIEHGGKWWITYHTKDAKTGGHFRRSVAIDEVKWDGDKILPVTQTWAEPLGRRGNLAVNAKASASYTESPPMTLGALNDGRPPVVRLPPDQWGNYRSNTSTQETDWIQYTWAKPVRINRAVIQFHQDPNWIQPPASWEMQYQDEAGDWKPVQGAKYPTAPDQWHTIDFAPVTTSALRAVFHGQKDGPYFHSVSVSEWEVYGPKMEGLPVAAIEKKAGEAPKQRK